jgi:glucose-6-phosphate 1-dehydrogenase
MMATQILRVERFDLVVFGGTGDLSYRKLYPALYRRHSDGQLTKETRIIAVSRQRISREDFREAVCKSLKRFDPVRAEDAGKLEAFVACLDYVAVDAGGEKGWDELSEKLYGDREGVRAFYLATAPELFALISQRLSRHDMVTPRTRVIVEKPIGKDAASAAAINDALGAVFTESQIYRIDHYLGKETVQNLMALRFANALFEPLWNSGHIDHVQITVAEDLGVESRAGYYDKSGALRDMVQNHLLQLLCLVAMEPPASLTADAVRDEKRKVLRSLLKIDAVNADERTVRGQYRAGAASGDAVPGYLEEVGNPDTTTETFVALKLEIENWRWAGVPFYLRTGKRLPERISEIVVTFRKVPHALFAGTAGKLHQTRLVIRLQPDEGIKLWLMIKEPGPGGFRLQHVPLDMSFAKAFSVHAPEAYERLLMDVIRGDATLFMRRDEVEAAWEFIDPIREAWAASKEAPRPYVAGSWGPSAAIALIERDGRTWLEDGE